jgi:hypothetical protein
MLFLILASDIFRGVMMMEIIEVLEGQSDGGVMDIKVAAINQSTYQSSQSLDQIIASHK